MTATDPRPQLAAMPAARLAPAAEALAEACAEDMGAAPPPADHRAGRAALAHPRQLLALLDWSAERKPGPERAGKPEFRTGPGDLERRVGLIPVKEGEEGRLIECHVGGRMFFGLPDTPGFEAWRERQGRREEREKEALAAQPGRDGPA